jgi:hypothetical protein
MSHIDFVGFAITLPNGWEIIIPAWAAAVGAMSTVAVVVALGILAAVRYINRRSKLPTDAP